MKQKAFFVFFEGLLFGDKIIIINNNKKKKTADTGFRYFYPK